MQRNFGQIRAIETVEMFQSCGIIDKKVWDVPNNMTKESIK